ncbi:unnamed protein product, partial [Effrenium voratum]
MALMDAESVQMPWKVQVSTGSTISDLGSEPVQDFSREGSSASFESEKWWPMGIKSDSSERSGYLRPTITPITAPPGLEAEAPASLRGLKDLHQLLQKELLAQQMLQLQPRLQVDAALEAKANQSATMPMSSPLPLAYGCSQPVRKLSQEDASARHPPARVQPAPARARQFCTACGGRLRT